MWHVPLDPLFRGLTAFGVCDWVIGQEPCPWRYHGDALIFLDFRVEWKDIRVPGLSPVGAAACLWERLSLAPWVTMHWVSAADAWAECLGVLICSSPGGLRVLKPQGQIPHWLFDGAAFQKQCGMLFTSRNINLTLWNRGIENICSSPMAKMVQYLLKLNPYGYTEQMGRPGGSEHTLPMCLGWHLFT